MTALRCRITSSKRVLASALSRLRCPVLAGCRSSRGGSRFDGNAFAEPARPCAAVRSVRRRGDADDTLLDADALSCACGKQLGHSPRSRRSACAARQEVSSRCQRRHLDQMRKLSAINAGAGQETGPPHQGRCSAAPRVEDGRREWPVLRPVLPRLARS